MKHENQMLERSNANTNCYNNNRPIMYSSHEIVQAHTKTNSFPPDALTSFLTQQNKERLSAAQEFSQISQRLGTDIKEKITSSDS